MAVRVESPDLKRLANDLQGIGPRVDREINRAHQKVATDIANAAARNVQGLTDAGGRGAAGIKGVATQNKASIHLLGSNQFVRAAVFGTELHWVYGNPIPASQMSRRVWRPWIGANWEPEEGLYGVSPAIKSRMDQTVETYSDGMMQALAHAFPEGSNG